MLQKMKEIYTHRRFTRSLMVLGTVLLFVYGIIRVPFVNIVWELADEYGYLANAAYMSKTDWSFMVNLYYGYGYSFWLIPLFWLCDTGTEIIRGAVFVNGICIVLLFWAQFFLMSAICRKLNRNVTALISFVLCFFPYLSASSMKVIPECLLTLMIWVCGLVMYRALAFGKGYDYILLAVCMIYTYFVHIRSFVFCAVLLLFIGIMFFQKRISKKNLLIFLAGCVVLFILGTLFKNHITEVVYSKNLFESTTEVRNTLSAGYVWDRITETLENFSWQQLQSLACKLFYLFVASAGMFYIGIFAAGKELSLDWRTHRQLSTETAIKLMYAVSAMMMVIALVVNPMGIDEGTGHYFYARYYEYLVGPVVFIGLCYCMERRLKGKELLLAASGFVLCTALALGLSKHLDTQELYADTNRMPALSFLLEFCHQYRDVIVVGFVAALFAILILWLLSRSRRFYWMAAVTVLLVFLFNDILIMRQIIRIHRYNNAADREVTDYIHENYDVDEVYFLNGDEVYITVYTSLQSLLGKEKLNVIKAEDLEEVESKDLMITFSGNPYVEQLEKPKTKLLTSGPFELYLVE